MVTIITPVYNAQSYLDQCIQSVLNQIYTDWELLIVNDGSNDRSKEIILSYSDNRIQYFEQGNSGVAVARNVGLEKMKGDFFCFLDADDILPPNSLFSRVEIFQRNSAIRFVDGKVLKYNYNMTESWSEWQPNFLGNPLNDLVRLTGKSFFGLTWMIRREQEQVYRFRKGLSHGEDLLFYMDMSRLGGEYTYVDEVVLHYRNTQGSAMKNLQGLEEGYRYIEKEIENWQELSGRDFMIFKFTWRKFMALDYFRTHEMNKIFRLAK